MTGPVSSEILKASCFPPFFFFFYSSAAAAPEEGTTKAFATKAAGLGRAASSVRSMEGKPIMLIMLGNSGVMSEVSKGFFYRPLFFG